MKADWPVLSCGAVYCVAQGDLTFASVDEIPKSHVVLFITLYKNGSKFWVCG